MNLTGIALAGAPAASGQTEVVSVRYDPQGLRIKVTDEQDTTIVVTFESVLGFRVLDEGDLLDFWEAFSSQPGWVYEVLSGGWHDHESLRNGAYLVPDVHPEAREFLVTGCDDCVSIIALNAPEFKREAEQAEAQNPGNR